MKCQNCLKHKGTDKWVGKGSMMDVIHGNYEIWCKCCMIKAQIEHAEKRANDLENLRKKLKSIKCK